MLCLYIGFEDDLVEDILVDVYLSRPFLKTGGFICSYLNIFIPKEAVSVKNPVGIDVDDLLRKAGDVQKSARGLGFYSYRFCEGLFHFLDLPVKLGAFLVGEMFLLEQ